MTGQPISLRDRRVEAACTARLVLIGDQMRLGDKEGVVVLSVDTDEYPTDFPKEQWVDTLKHGVLLHIHGTGLIHCLEPEDDLPFIASGGEELSMLRIRFVYDL